MSNCIHFHNPEVFFSAAEFQVSDFRSRCERLKSFLPWKMPDATDEERAEQYFVWYLACNSKFTQDGVMVSFGEGHSTHTHRDFRYTVEYLLAPYMKRNKVHTFVLSDEYDGFKSKFRQMVVFRRKKEVRT